MNNPLKRKYSGETVEQLEEAKFFVYDTKLNTKTIYHGIDQVATVVGKLRSRIRRCLKVNLNWHFGRYYIDYLENGEPDKYLNKEEIEELHNRRKYKQVVHNKHNPLNPNHRYFKEGSDTLSVDMDPNIFVIVAGVSNDVYAVNSIGEVGMGVRYL